MRAPLLHRRWLRHGWHHLLGGCWPSGHGLVAPRLAADRTAAVSSVVVERWRGGRDGGGARCKGDGSHS